MVFSSFDIIVNFWDQIFHDLMSFFSEFLAKYGVSTPKGNPESAPEHEQH